MNEISLLIGGKAGFGIDTASLIIARILNQLGLRLYIYRDYPSLIRGGHTFSIVRAAEKMIYAHREKVDFLIALNQDTVDLHRDKIKDGTIIIYDSDTVKSEGTGISLGKIIQEENAPEIMRNTAVTGAFSQAAGIPWDITEKVLKNNIAKEVDLNLKVARRGFDAVGTLFKLEPQKEKILPILTGNEALSLGLIRGGLKNYVAYPMTPCSSVLHFMASAAPDFGLKVLHPESEISVILMALGFSYMGEKTAVGTSGGGFCLMVEGLSFSGMSELPVVIIVGQRPGPSTGLPTYSAQTELSFVLNAGQGEFSRLVVAPGDAEEAYYLSALCLNLSWKYQLPAIILTDKNLSEGAYSFNIDSAGEINEEQPLMWGRQPVYKRYLNTETGVSPLAFVPDKDAVIKINSYEHDESGITTEDVQLTKLMQEKRLRKEKYLSEELEKYKTVEVSGNKQSGIVLVCWGSNKGVCIEAAGKNNLRVIHPLVLRPFPITQFQQALQGVEKIICVENNAGGQLADLLNLHGIRVDARILKYDGRPFTLEELESEIEKAVK